MERDKQRLERGDLAQAICAHEEDDDGELISS
jgi:hypothetical protein